MRLVTASATHVGQVREINQDRALVTGTLGAVADGMGGHVGGEKAGSVGDRRTQRRPRLDLRAAAGRRGPRREPTGLRGRRKPRNCGVWARPSWWRRSIPTPASSRSSTSATVGGTCSAAERSSRSPSTIRWSRNCSGRVGSVRTRPAIIRSGTWSPGPSASVPRSRSTSSVSPVEPGDRVLLCSDGLSNEVSDDEVAVVLGEVLDPREAAQQLVDRAVRHGGRDNVTVVILALDANGGGPVAADPGR